MNARLIILGLIFGYGVTGHSNNYENGFESAYRLNPRCRQAVTLYASQHLEAKGPGAIGPYSYFEEVLDLAGVSSTDRISLVALFEKTRTISESSQVFRLADEMLEKEGDKPLLFCVIAGDCSLRSGEGARYVALSELMMSPARARVIGVPQIRIEKKATARPKERKAVKYGKKSDTRLTPLPRAGVLRDVSDAVFIPTPQRFLLKQAVWISDLWKAIFKAALGDLLHQWFSVSEVGDPYHEYLPQRKAMHLWMEIVSGYYLEQLVTFRVTSNPETISTGSVFNQAAWNEISSHPELSDVTQRLGMNAKNSFDILDTVVGALSRWMR